MSQKPKQRGGKSHNNNTNTSSSGHSSNDETERESLIQMVEGVSVGVSPTNIPRMTIDHDPKLVDVSNNVNPLNDDSNKNRHNNISTTMGISSTGLFVLLLLAVQNCSKNLLMRYVMKDQPKFLTSIAVIGSEFIKLLISICVILFYEKQSLYSIIQFVLYDDRINTILVTVPASAYNLQMKLEYIALANIDAAMFSVLVQLKLLFTAIFSYIVLRKKLKYIQIISLLLLTVGVMLCNMKTQSSHHGRRLIDVVEDMNDDPQQSSITTDHTIITDTPTYNITTGIIATIGIALSSGFASVYTEKVIKGGGQQQKKKDHQESIPLINNSEASTDILPATTLIPLSNNNITIHNNTTPMTTKYGLWHTQVQLAIMSLITIGIYAVYNDYTTIMKYGIFYQFTFGALISLFNSAIGGLIVAAVLKYADSILKGYATAMSVILTGVLSMILFGTNLSIIYFMGIINVVTAVLLYNGKDMDQLVC